MNCSEPNPDFENLLNYLNFSRGIDFTGYKRNSLQRLTKRRMQQVGVESFGEYLDYLQVHPNEHNSLFNSLMLNVTAFFRDRSTWDFLSAEIVPRILQSKSDEAIRIWSAGCASGEEAYSLAIVFAEILGIEEFGRVKIYATDLDEGAIGQGRQALYTAKSLEALSPEIQDKYFESKGSHYAFRSDLRRCVVFGRHDLICDAPISRLDLLCCRNTLMYFNAETQAKVLHRFHFALQEHGYLFVGKAEMLLAQSGLFTSVDRKNRIFSKVAQVNWRDRLMSMSQGGNLQAVKMLKINLKLRDEVFDASPVAQIVLEESNNVTMVNHQARTWFGLNTNIGQPFEELELNRQIPQLLSVIQQARSDLCCSAIDNVRLKTADNAPSFFDVQIIPLTEGNNQVIGVNIAFINVDRYQDLRQQLDKHRNELEAVREELQFSGEELETTNEELQSTNEELETTNEELQSTNQELETMNEELQSSNEELQHINEELNVRTEQLNRVSMFMESILTSLKMGMTVLDSRLSVQVWNDRMNELWGLRSEETYDRFFFDLDTGLPLEQLRSIIRNCHIERSDYQEITVQAVNRRGKIISCRIICTPLKIEQQHQGIILLMEVTED